MHLVTLMFDELHFLLGGTNDMNREATTEDLGRIAALKLNMFDESGLTYLLSKNAYQEIQIKYMSLYEDNMAQHFVIEKNNNIIACAGAFLKNDLPYCFFNQSTYGFIGDVYTLQDYRRQGYAHLLMNKVIEWFRSREIKTIRLLATPQARSMYAELGFKPTDEMVLRLDKLNG